MGAQNVLWPEEIEPWLLPGRVSHLAELARKQSVVHFSAGVAAQPAVAAVDQLLQEPLGNSYAWFGRYHRLSKNYEKVTASSEAMIYLASIQIMLKRRPVGA